MTGDTRHPDAVRLDAIRRRRRLINSAQLRAGAEKPEEWSPGYVGSERMVLNGDGDPIMAMTHAASNDEFEFAAAAPSDIAFLIGLVDRAAAAVREARGALDAFRRANPLQGEEPGASLNYAAEAAIKVQSVGFRQFLRWHTDAQPVGGASGDRDPVDIATDRLRAILGITSRKQLNTEPDAAQRWLVLRAEYWEFEKMPDEVRRAQYPGYGSSMREAAE